LIRLVLNELSQTDRSQSPQRVQEHRSNDPRGQTAFTLQYLSHGLTAETVIASLEKSGDYEAFEAAVISNYDAESPFSMPVALIGP
jgi:hypothetical protein